jgi:hypothetical protein
VDDEDVALCATNETVAQRGQVTLDDVDSDSVPGLHPAAEHHPGELVLDQPLDRPAQRACAEPGVEALPGEQLDGVVAERDLDPLRTQPAREAVEKELS